MTNCRWRRPTLKWILLLFLFWIMILFMYFVPGMYSKSPKNSVQNNINKWLDNACTKCDGNFRGYTNEFAWLKHVRFDKSRKVFSIPCEHEIPTYSFLYGKEGTVLEKWLREIQTYPYENTLHSTNHAIERMTTTFAVMRYEAHNLYHTLCEWFNIFLICELFHIDPSGIDVLFMDDRPRGLMDDTWDTLFAKVGRYSNLTEQTVFKNLVWNVIGYESPLNFHELRTVPYIDGFRKFFLDRFGIKDDKHLDCKRLNVTIIWRRDYMSHPERKEETNGLMHRKFQNEKEILAEIRIIFEGHGINEILLEELSMKRQIEIMSKTDILFGMHGAGMAHVLFLPKHAAVFETFPNYWGFQIHFKAFARWRGIKYLGWKNESPDNEFPNFHTRVPVEVIRSHMTELKDYLCRT